MRHLLEEDENVSDEKRILQRASIVSVNLVYVENNNLTYDRLFCGQTTRMQVMR